MARSTLPPTSANTAVLVSTGDLSVQPVDLRAEDGAASSGLIYRPNGRTSRVGVHLMHPRTDQTRNYNIGPLVEAGFTVLARTSRSVNNDAETLHEDLLLDVAAGVRHLREQGCDTVVLLGNSGGAPLAAMYQSQAELPPDRRLDAADTVSSTDLRKADLPAADAYVSIGGHLGQGPTLLKLLDASVVDENDPASIDPSVDIYDPVNGFSLPVADTRYSPEFIADVRAAQLRRVERIDRLARAAIARSDSARRLVKQLPVDGVSERDRYRIQRAAATREYLVIYRTLADPAMVDVSSDPDDRVAGGFESHSRPDIQNFAQAGFAHYLSPRAWLSTWSALSSNASMMKCLPGVGVPTLFVHYAGDIFVRMAELADMTTAAGADDRTSAVIPMADHYGRTINSDGTLAGRTTSGTTAVANWLLERFMP
ncbi:MAG: alpha/beta hydrolase [Pseudonocardiales bacterium]|nr:alpha/beta hydrolase [Pseudonocardiales bacterium]